MSKRGNYGKWNEANLVLALNEIRSGTSGVNVAARTYGIPQTTLKRHFHEQNKRSGLVKCFGRQPVFTEAMERELQAHILKFEERMFGLTTKDVRKLAFDVAKMHGVAHCFNEEKGTAGKKWFYKFMKRNPRLSLRQPESTSLARMKGFSRERVGEFFDLLESLVDKHSLNGTKIYNVDESGFTTVQKKPQKVVGLKGKHQVGAASSGERGVNTTVVCCVGASGSYIPPMFIFKRKRRSPELEKGAPAGSLVEISDTGYITSELLVQWLRHFKEHVVCSKENPILLLLDGHSTHSKNLDALLFARENGIILLQLPSHTTHRMQPLDVAFFRPLGIYYIQAQETFLRKNLGKPITQYDVVTLLSEAYGRAATVGIAENSFRASGIWPVNRHVFQDHDFAPSDALRATASVSDQPIQNPTATVTAGPVPSTTRSFSESLTLVSPIPQASLLPNKRKQQSAEVLTSTPYKEELENQKLKSNEKLMKAKRAVFTEGNSTAVAPVSKKKKKIESDSDDSAETFEASGSSSGGEDFINPDDFKDFDRDELKEEDYVLVYFKDDKGKAVYYVGQILQNGGTANSLTVSFMRKSNKIKNAFVFPAVPDILAVDDCDIKMILSNPQKHGQTKRQQSYVSFGVEFNVDVR